MNLKYLLQHGMMNLTCQMDHILYPISFTDQKSLPLEIEDKINLTLIIK